MYISKACLLC